MNASNSRGRYPIPRKKEIALLPFLTMRSEGFRKLVVLFIIINERLRLHFILAWKWFFINMQIPRKLAKVRWLSPPKPKRHFFRDFHLAGSSPHLRTGDIFFTTRKWWMNTCYFRLVVVVWPHQEGKKANEEADTHVHSSSGCFWRTSIGKLPSLANMIRACSFRHEKAVMTKLPSDCL